MAAGMPDLAILYEHPAWFEPLFAALDRRGIAYEKIVLTDHRFDPAAGTPPAPVILSRVAMSSFLREADHGIFYAEALRQDVEDRADPRQQEDGRDRQLDELRDGGDGNGLVHRHGP